MFDVNNELNLQEFLRIQLSLINEVPTMKRHVTTSSEILSAAPNVLFVLIKRASCSLSREVLHDISDMIIDQKLESKLKIIVVLGRIDTNEVAALRKYFSGEIYHDLSHSLLSYKGSKPTIWNLVKNFLSNKKHAAKETSEYLGFILASKKGILIQSTNDNTAISSPLVELTNTIQYVKQGFRHEDSCDFTERDDETSESEAKGGSSLFLASKVTLTLQVGTRLSDSDL